MKYKNNESNIPEPTFAFLLDIGLCFGSLFGGISIILSTIYNNSIDTPIWVLIGSLIFVIAGIIFLSRVIRQIKLRIKWNEKHNFKVTERKISTKEANMRNIFSPDPEYHIDIWDKAMGVNYEAKLKTDKYGNTYMVTKTRLVL